MKDQNKYQELIGKYFSGNCSEEEKTLIERWLSQSPDGLAVFNDFDQIWKVTGLKASINETLEIEKDWLELNKRIIAVESINEEINAGRFTISKKIFYHTTRIAAVLLIAFGFLFLINQMNRTSVPVTIEYTAANVSQTPLILADGSEVFLNQGAEISYPEAFTGDNRKINFEGDAFFHVAHNPEKPFFITVGSVEIEVLGTEFNLSANPESDEVVLCLETGKVRFSSINKTEGTIEEQVILTPGQKGVFNKKSGLISRAEMNNRNYLAWKTGVLVFDKTSLDEVISSIEQTYNIKVVSNKSLAELFLTARFENEKPESIFESLHTIFGIQYSIEGDTVFLN